MLEQNLKVLITEAKHRQNTLIEEKIKEKFLKEMQLNSNDEYALINSGVFPVTICRRLE